MTKLFISYRSLDSAKVDAIVARLRSLKDENGAPLYDIWQDKTSIPPGHDWWKSIVQGIIKCDVFVFMISHESVKNVNCRAELSYARKRNRPIIPLALEDEFYFNPVTGKNDVAYWGDMPEVINDTRSQFLFYEGTSFVGQFNDAIARLNNLDIRDIPADEPPDPRNANDATNDTTLIYDQACDYAWRLEFTTAEKLFQRLIGWNDDLFADDAHEWMVLLRQYQRMVKLDARASMHYKIPALWEEYVKQFPKPFVPMFDPKGIGDRHIQRGQTETVSLTQTPPPPEVKTSNQSSGVYQPTLVQHDPPPQKVEISKPTPKPQTPKVLTLDQYAQQVRNIIGDPFEWCEVPAGKFLYGDEKRELELPAFAMAKYPITYSQFQPFIDASDGFYDDRWWEGLAAGNRNRANPGEQKWKIADHPCERVSWYDAMAFSRWLSFKLGGGYAVDDVVNWVVRLPTEFEWEKSARGTGGLGYSYGDNFDLTKSNTRESNIGQTTPVGNYSQGVSPYGVFDMSGNVWEWCLNDSIEFDLPSERLSSNHSRILRGGSFANNDYKSHSAYRFRFSPYDRGYNFGFRLCLCRPVG